MKIGLLGLFGTGNSGNDGSLEAMIEFLREAAGDAEIVCFCPNPGAIEWRFGVRAVSTGYDSEPEGVFGRLNRALRDLPRRCLTMWHPFRQAAGLDVLIVPGTGFLDDFRDGPFGWPFMVLRWCLAARLAGARIAFVSIGAGPIRNGLSRRILTRVARLAHYRSYRDEASRRFMASIGLDTSRDTVFPDLAFRLKTPGAGRSGGREGVTVGLGVMAYSGWSGVGEEARRIYGRYIAELARFVRLLQEKGYAIRLLTGDAEDDEAVGKLLDELKKTGSDRPLPVVNPAYTLQELMDEISLTDIVVCTRFHNVVCAVKLARPTLSLSYAAKNDVLLDDVGLGRFHWHVEGFDADALMARFEEALADRERLSAGIRARTAYYARRLAEQEKVLEETILRPPTRVAAPVEVSRAGSRG
jgi:polysaccharide pyruvyl transferase WcaK-like protein